MGTLAIMRLAGTWAGLAGSVLVAYAQGPAQAPGASATPQVSSTPSSSAPDAAPQAPASMPTAAPTPQKHKSGKDSYTGPTEVIVLPPAPMLDDDGKQRLDPDGKPMFLPPVMQLRDKHGHPVFDEHGKPVFQTATDLGYDEDGHRIRVKKEKPPKATPVVIARGTFTVDGVIGKAALNYDISDLKYIYFFVPGEGVVVVSNAPFPGAKEQKDAFNDTSLKVNADGHEMELASERRLLGRKPESAYVWVDRDFRLHAAFPVVGYGTLRKPPYVWPGAKENTAFRGPVQPPPVPQDLRPVLAKPNCPAGQVMSAGAGKNGAAACVPAKTPTTATAAGAVATAKP